jgi:hypothetical protein
MKKELIDSAIQALSIQAVFLEAGAVTKKKGFVPPFMDAELELIPQYKFAPAGEYKVITGSNDNSEARFKVVVFNFSAAVRLVDQRFLEALEKNPNTADDAVYVEIAAEFSANYRLKEEADENGLRDALSEFSQINVGYHVWPYWREYVQSTCTRIGIPPIPVPIYQVPCTAE